MIYKIRQTFKVELLLQLSRKGAKVLIILSSLWRKREIKKASIFEMILMIFLKIYRNAEIIIPNKIKFVSILLVFSLEINFKATLSANAINLRDSAMVAPTFLKGAQFIK